MRDRLLRGDFYNSSCSLLYASLYLSTNKLQYFQILAIFFSVFFLLLIYMITLLCTSLYLQITIQSLTVQI